MVVSGISSCIKDILENADKFIKENKKRLYSSIKGHHYLCSDAFLSGFFFLSIFPIPEMGSCFTHLARIY